MASTDSFGAKGTIPAGGAEHEIFRLSAVEGADRLPFSLKVLLENLLRTEDGANVTADHIRALAGWDPTAEPDTEIQFTPARVIMQDFTGVPCVVDLATMREAVTELGGDPAKVNPLAPAELVIDHSVIIDVFGTPDAFERNVDFEYERNKERYQFLRWGQGAFDEFKVVPPGTGHRAPGQHRAPGPRRDDAQTARPTRTRWSAPTRTPRWSTASACSAGASAASRPRRRCSASPSRCSSRGSSASSSPARSPPGATATDVVLTITEMLRRHGVVGKFVEFYGEGVGAVPLANRATIGNMSPEFGSTAAIFPIDDETVRYLQAHRPPGRPASRSSRPTPRSRASGTTRPASPSSPRPSSWTCPRSSRRSPGPSARRTASSSPTAKQAFRSVLVDYAGTPDQTTRTTPRRPGTLRRRVGRGDLPRQRPGRARRPVRGRGPAPGRCSPPPRARTAARAGR